MTELVNIAGLQIAKPLYDLVKNEISPGTGIQCDDAWHSFAQILTEMSTKNRALLARRDELQARIDAWHLEHKNENIDYAAYKAYLKEIGYLLEEGDDFSITTDNIDEEIANIAGPQLVVPVSNARYALNAANARWGSLFDALYGTDVIAEDNGAHKGANFNPVRGAKVIAYAKAFLDEAAPLQDGSYIDAIAYKMKDGQLSVTLSSGQRTGLKNPEQFKGYQETDGKISSLLLSNNNLYIEIHFNTDHPIHELHPTGIRDIYLESAISTIMDCEDSVAAVDASDKVKVYRNWLGLMKGDLSVSFNKKGTQVKRSLQPNRRYLSADGSFFEVPARSLMLIRNVGHLMTTGAVLDAKGVEIHEGLLDSFITSYCALHDLKQNSPYQNSRKGNIYIVKPKMHGPEEVAFTVSLFEKIENAFGLERNTIKVGIMDEERRTTLNLKECIRAASERVIFINTGFLDRTGDEIHTSMEAGAMVRKDDMKAEPWLKAYENWNVDIGLACGLAGKAQIGKGMWTMPDLMSEMMEKKRIHPEAGANTAWVPSPTAATLHAIHYHQVCVADKQKEIMQRERASIDDLLTIPLATSVNWSAEEIQQELDNNMQGLLGYVVRWIDQGMGASKVPDINDIGLMEDRATLRISSQHIANWLYHGVVSEKQVMVSLKRMAEFVDRQNIGVPNYISMGPHYISLAFQTAQDMIFHGRRVPNGYTEPTLHRRRKQLKAALKGDY
ncbi:MAG: malate synthase G [Gammaproteobacteria bacterium]|nr:malate synthase G [Gammaproteobacteria bacterium]